MTYLIKKIHNWNSSEQDKSKHNMCSKNHFSSEKFSKCLLRRYFFCLGEKCETLQLLTLKKLEVLSPRHIVLNDHLSPDPPPKKKALFGGGYVFLK